MKYIELTQIGLSEEICKYLDRYRRRRGDITWLAPEEIFYQRDPSMFGPRGFIVLGRNGRGAAIGAFSTLYGFPEVSGIYQRETAGGEIWKITDLDLKKIIKNHTTRQKVS